MESHRRILHDVTNLPTAPFVETHVVEYIRRFVARRPRLTLSSDRYGNLLVRYALRAGARGRSPSRLPRKGRLRPILFAAHMDHPGFVATGMTDDRHVRADFRGWVQAPYFRNQRVVFFSDGAWVRGRIVEIIAARRGARTVRATASARSFGADAPPEAVVAAVPRAVQVGAAGMWALPDARVGGHRIHARACDDVAGLAAILCMLDAICRRPIAVPCYAFFTRAEEVGFAGALAAVADRTVPRDAIVVAVECSKAIAGVSFGGGPILRVGDRASVFTPAATAYCQVVAERLAARDKGFAFQRKLMDGGTCESTAYCHYGYDATGLCLPLGNYHNMNLESRRIDAEYIDVRDFDNLVKWFVALAAAPAEIAFDGSHPGLDERLTALLRRYRGLLQRTAGVVTGG